MGLGSELVDWYRDATSVSFGHLLIDLSPRTDDRLRYCTNSGSVPSKFCIPERLKHLRTLDDEHTKSLYSPSVPIAFPQMQKSLSSVLPKRVYPVSMRMHSKSDQRKLANHIKTSRDKVSRRSLVTITKKNNLEPKKKRSVVRKRIATNSRHLPSLIICLDMEQFVLVPASVYNKSVTALSVTKKELPKYRAEQPPTYQIDSLKRDINKKLFGKADTLIDKILSCSRIKLSNSQTIILDGVDTGVLISDFTLHLRRKNSDVPDIYFTLLDTAGISPSLVFNQNAKAKDRGSWIPFKVLQKLQRLYTQGAAAYGSVRNLAKASRLPVSKVRQFLHSKDSYKKFTLAARKFKTMRAFARFRNEIWCMDLAYVDKLAKENNGVNYLLVRQDLFDRTVNAKGMKTKDSEETVKAFSSMITKMN